MATNRIPPSHPGRILRLDFMEPLGLSSYRVAKDIDVPAPRINSIVNEKRSISADTAIRLARYFGTSAEFWMNLQSLYDLETARDQAGDEVERIQPCPA